MIFYTNDKLNDYIIRCIYNSPLSNQIEILDINIPTIPEFIDLDMNSISNNLNNILFSEINSCKLFDSIPNIDDIFSDISKKFLYEGDSVDISFYNYMILEDISIYMEYTVEDDIVEDYNCIKLKRVINVTKINYSELLIESFKHLKDNIDLYEKELLNIKRVKLYTVVWLVLTILSFVFKLNTLLVIIDIIVLIAEFLYLIFSPFNKLAKDINKEIKNM